MTKRFEKYGDVAIKTLTLPVRIVVGVVNAVTKNMPETLEIPYELKRKKGEKHGSVIEGSSEEIKF
jgi:hypothetical protein|tara:strand:- start:200 stop:397 length:198 start_codon:yes stop_codon:yes gene_type:complete